LFKITEIKRKKLYQSYNLENRINNEEFSTSKQEKQGEYQQIHQKMDEFVHLLADAEANNTLLQELQIKFNTAIRAAADSTALEPYKRMKNNIQNEDADSEFGQLLLMNDLDKSAQKKLAIWQIISMVVRLIIALLLILLGFGMIIMPAPPYFEMFTLFYLNPNDGVTIMDVISLIVAFIGVYLLISTLAKRKPKR
jgi:hypothetical protein